MPADIHHEKEATLRPRAAIQDETVWPTYVVQPRDGTQVDVDIYCEAVWSDVRHEACHAIARSRDCRIWGSPDMRLLKLSWI